MVSYKEAFPDLVGTTTTTTTTATSSTTVIAISYADKLKSTNVAPRRPSPPPTATSPTTKPFDSTPSPPPLQGVSRLGEDVQRRLTERHGAIAQEREEWRRMEALERGIMAVEDQRSRLLFHDGGGGDDDDEAATAVTSTTNATAASEGWHSFLHPASGVKASLLAPVVTVPTTTTTTPHNQRHPKPLKGEIERVVREGHWRDLVVLLDQGADFDERGDDGSKMNAFHYSCAMDKSDMLEVLVRMRPWGIESVDRKKMTPLMHAAKVRGRVVGIGVVLVVLVSIRGRADEQQKH